MRYCNQSPLIGSASADLARYDGSLAAIPNAAVLLSPLTTNEAVLLWGKNMTRKGSRFMKSLKIKWQRLLDESGQTCPRCGSTEKEIEKASHSLKQSLAPLGIEVILEKKVLDPVIFAKDVLESNRIWIAERPLEEWLGAEVGQSLCCEVCGNAECRTVEVGEKVYETIPAALIIKAGLIAASQIVTAEPNEPL